MENVIIKSSKVKLDYSAFLECKRLEKVIFEAGKVECDPLSFNRCKYILPEEFGGYKNGNNEVILYKVETGFYDFNYRWVKGGCNSACGVDLKIKLKNNYDATIKYIIFNVTPQNAVGDDVASSYESQMVPCKITGPIESQKSYEGYWENKWYNSTIVSAKITEIRIEYINGELIRITGDNIIYEEQPVLSGNCYVATCVYGSYDCPQVWTLRRFRDYSLAKTWHGRLFIKTYYTVSPIIVNLFGNTKWFKKMWKNKLDKMVDKLQSKGFENTPYDDRKW